MSWWNPIKLAGLREQLITRLRRRLLPLWAVFQADLASLVHSWVLRAWLVLTALLALVTLLDHSDPPLTAQPSGSGVIAAILHPIETTSGEVRIVQELLKYYIVVWVTFVIVLTAGTVTSELGVVADSVLSRGISRRQYFLGKLTARLCAVLGVYALVMIPTGLVLWLGVVSEGSASGSIVPASVGTNELYRADSLSLGGLSLGLVRVAAFLGVVVTCCVASSANFSSTTVSIAVGWVTLYGTGLALSMLDVRFLSPTRLIRELPNVLQGECRAVDQFWTIGGWLALAGVIALASGLLFARRDV